MLFNSYIFILLFLPVTFAGYFALNHFQKKELAKLYLVAMSVWFYSYFHASYLWIILFSIGINYFCHLLLIRRWHTRLTLLSGIFINLGLLIYYKYFAFLLENFNRLFHSGFSLPDILMPLGISFFTFQQIGFLADSAKGEVRRQSLLDYALFVTFFPQLIAGPIVSHEEMLPQFQDPARKQINAENVYKGLRLFVLGLSKKVLLADTFGQAVNWGFQNYMLLDSLNTFAAMLFFTFQLYFDFSGYCDMARGLGYLFNIDIPVNFLSPYKAGNISEFWDRWHITLTRFFTRYVYIPLGGSRKGKLRTYVNILLVFLVSGFWHGAGWNYIAWGLLHGVFSVLTRIWHTIKKPGKSNAAGRAVSVCLTFLLTCCLWTFFRAGSMAQAIHMLKQLTLMRGGKIYLEYALLFEVPEISYGLKLLNLDALPYSSYFCLGAFVSLAFILVFGCKNLYESEAAHRPSLIKTVSLSLLAVWCIVSLSGVSTFLYFNF